MFRVFTPIVVLIAALLLPLPACAQSFGWIVGSQGKLVDEGNAVCVDADGNSYVTGRFSAVRLRLVVLHLFDPINGERKP